MTFTDNQSEALADVPPARIRSVLAYRDYRLFLGARLLSTLAVQIQSVAVGWQIYAISRDPLSLGVVGLAQFLPMLALTLPAGDLADRFNRRSILTISCLLGAAVAAGFLLLTVFKVETLWPYYLVLALFGVVRTLSGPAGQSLVPILVPEAHISRAIAWASSAFQTATIVGPAFGGGLYLLGPEAAYAGCFILSIVAGTQYWMIRTRMAPRSSAYAGKALRRVVAGIHYVRARPIILGAISLDLFAVLLGGATALLPVYASDILMIGPIGLGILRTAPAVGAAVTGLVLGQWSLKRHAGPWMFACVALFGIATVVFGVSHNFTVSLIALVVLGASDMVSVFVRSTLIQLATPDEMRGRVSAVSMLFVGASNELGEFESGTTAAWFGTVPSVIVGGVGTLVVVGLWMWLFPTLRRVDRLGDVKPPDAVQAQV